VKKFILLLAGIYVAVASAAPAFVITGTVLAAVTASFLSIATPIAQKAIGSAANEIQGVITGTKCPIGCRGPLALPCKTASGLSLCKGVCQKIKQVGGYELKIRFGKDWDLLKCVRHRVRSGKNSPQGKGNAKSIAVYSQTDLDDLLSLIALQMAARQIIDTKAQGLKNEELSAAETDRETVVNEAKDLVEHVTKSIETKLATGLYGNQ